MADMSDSSELSNLLVIAHQLADAAGTIALKYFRSADCGMANKLDHGFDPVTRADREIESCIRSMLDELRPDDGILGEEFASRRGSSRFTWVIDPIDGTRSYISGTPVWGILIAVNDGHSVVLGMIDQPFTGERFFGAGNRSWLSRAGNTVRQRTRSCARMEDAVLFTTFPEIGTSAERNAFSAVSRCARLTRYGMDCYAYALLAGGHIDLVIEAGLNTYDIQAPIGVIEASGGVVTDWNGGSAMNGGQVLAAGDARLHERVVRILRNSADH